jgi:hypothetical protein
MGLKLPGHFIEAGIGALDGTDVSRGTFCRCESVPNCSLPFTAVCSHNVLILLSQVL